MAPDVFNDLKEHYIALAKELSSRAREAALLTNPTGVGTEREEVYRTFLERYLPKMCDVFLGGYVFNLKGSVSSQIDIIVTGGNTPRFRLSGSDRFIAPLEGTVAAVEVKSKLDKANLFDALEGFASIPCMPDPSGVISPLVRIGQERWDDIPYKIIVAFDAVEKETIWRHLNQFYAEHGEIPIGRRANVIHVLENYAVLRITDDVKILNPG